MRWKGQVAHMEVRRHACMHACRVLMGKPGGKRPLGRSLHTEDNIKMDLQEVGWWGTSNGLI